MISLSVGRVDECADPKTEFADGVEYVEADENDDDGVNCGVWKVVVVMMVVVIMLRLMKMMMVMTMLVNKALILVCWAE